MMPVVERLEAEMRVVRAAVEALLADGWQVSVWDGEETTVTRSTDADVICAALRTTDEDTLRCHKPASDGKEARNAAVWLVYGNDPWEVICDHSADLTPVLAPAEAIADEIEKAAWAAGPAGR